MMNVVTATMSAMNGKGRLYIQSLTRSSRSGFVGLVLLP
jgi:hypothetical protein